MMRIRRLSLLLVLLLAVIVIIVAIGDDDDHCNDSSITDGGNNNGECQNNNDAYAYKNRAYSDEDDDDDGCDALADDGECESNRQYMLKHCKHSCIALGYQNFNNNKNRNKEQFNNNDEDDNDDDEDKQLDLSPLKPGQVQLATTKNGRIVSSYGCRVGLPSSLRKSLLNYCETMGLKEKLINLLQKNTLEADDDTILTLSNDDKWNAHRPDSHWHSNMHWVEPYNPSTQESIYTVLGDGNLDVVLDGIGKYFDLDTIYIHSFSFIAVTNAYGSSYLHYDFQNTGGKGFNIIVPLINVESSTDPELYVQDETTGYLHKIKYNYETAFVTGEMVMHMTSPVNYNISKGEMRMSATIYLMDITPENVDTIVGDTTPSIPQDTRTTLLQKRGLHWNSNKNKQIRLPRSTITTLSDDEQ